MFVDALLLPVSAAAQPECGHWRLTGMWIGRGGRVPERPWCIVLRIVFGELMREMKLTGSNPHEFRSISVCGNWDEEKEKRKKKKERLAFDQL